VQLVTIDDIRAAAELIRPYIVRTPLVPAGWADDERPLWIKPENLQQIGAFGHGKPPKRAIPCHSTIQPTRGLQEGAGEGCLRG